MQLSKMLRFGEKTVWFVVVEKPSAHPGKTKSHQKRPNSLANATHAASGFQKHTLKFLSINIITRFCSTMQSPENIKKYIVPRCYSTILQQIQSSAQK